MRYILLITTIGLLSANAYSAMPGGGRSGESPAFDRVDTDQDGAISRREAASFFSLDMVFDTVDLNKDGTLDQLEYSRADIPRRK